MTKTNFYKKKSASINFVVYTIILLIIFTSHIFSQQHQIIADSNWIQVDSIKIVGNETTKEFVILRELTFSVGDSINNEIIYFNRERVFSLGLFNKAEITIDNLGEKNIIKISVEESWYLYPIPFVKINENSIKKATFGINFLYKNFRGRNETLSAVVSAGYDPVNILSYLNPTLNEGKDISLLALFISSDISNKSLTAKKIFGKEFSYRMLLGEIDIGKRFNQFSTIYGIAGFNYIEAPQSTTLGITASKEKIDRSFNLGAQYIYDSRNLKQFPEDGILFITKFKHYGFNLNNISYNMFDLDFREYRKLFNTITTKWRIKYTHTFGKLVPFYDRTFLGFGDIIRGHQNDEREGHNLILASLEFSYPIIKELSYSFKLPLIPRKLTSGRFAVHFNLFTDTGTTYDNSKPVMLKEFDSGYGLGLTLLLLPYNSLRFEYAINEFKKGEFIFGTGFSF